MNERQLLNFKYNVYKDDNSNILCEAKNDEINMAIVLKTNSFDNDMFFIINFDQNNVNSKSYSLPLRKKAYKKYNFIYEQSKMLINLIGNTAKNDPAKNYDWLCDSTPSYNSYYPHYRHNLDFGYDYYTPGHLSHARIEKMFKDTIDVTKPCLSYYKNLFAYCCVGKDFSILPNLKYNLENNEVKFEEAS